VDASFLPVHFTTRVTQLLLAATQLKFSYNLYTISVLWAKFQTSAALYLRPSPFWNVTWPRLVVVFWRFGTLYRWFHIRGKRNPRRRSVFLLEREQKVFQKFQ